MNKNLKLINELASHLENYQKVNSLVSQQNVGWHIAHSCKVINSITQAIIKSDPNKAQSQFSFKFYFVLFTNHFPRGKASAPSFVIPAATISKEEILVELEAAKQSIQTLLKTERDKYFTHPVFGDLTVNKTLKFLTIHTYHHLKIIKDI